MTLNTAALYAQTKFLPKATRFAMHSPADKLYMNTEFQETLVNNQREAFRQGIKGAVLDLKLYTSNYGFDLKQIQVPTFLWYGAQDTNVSVKMGEYYHQSIPGSKLVIYEDSGHSVLSSHGEEILRKLRS